MDRVEKYFAKHVVFNKVIHVLVGVGIGIALTHGLFDPHPVRWAGFFIVVAALGYWYAYDSYKGK